MGTGAHTIVYAPGAERARAFLRDVPGFGHVDAGHGWLIFALPPGAIAAHGGHRACMKNATRGRGVERP